MPCQESRYRPPDAACSPPRPPRVPPACLPPSRFLATAETNDAIRPFRVNVPEEDARRPAPAHRRDALARPGDASPITRRACSSRRCRSSRTTGRPTTTGARSRRRLNALPQFITEIDGLDIHFIHVRSKHANALPLIVTHGWPGSVIEQLKIIEPADQSHGAWRERGGRVPRRDPVAAGLRLLRQADRRPAGTPSASPAPGPC